MTKLLKSLPARCWVISLGLFLATLAAAHFFPSEILTASAKLAALPFLICSIVFFCYLGFKATCNPIGLIAITTMFLAVAYWQASWAIFCVGLSFLGLSGLIHLFQRQLKDTGRELSLSEKKYWYWVNEFADGRSSILPKKPKNSQL
ncbi:entry exclusion protein EexR [Vibrio cholerae]